MTLFPYREEKLPVIVAVILALLVFLVESFIKKVFSGVWEWFVNFFYWVRKCQEHFSDVRGCTSKCPTVYE